MGFLVVLVALSAFFSSSETAYSSVNRIRLRAAADDGDKKAACALRVAENFDKTLSTLLIGNNIVNISASSISTLVATQLLGPATGALVATVVMTLVILTFGEILPKTLAMQHSEALSLRFGSILSFLNTLFSPLTAFFVWLKKLVLPKKKDDTPSVTEEELKYIIETIESEGGMDEEETDLVQSALEFDDTKVKEILIPRVDMVAVDLEDSPEEIRHAILSENHSRIPVYEKSIDNIIGILTIRAYLEALLKDPKPDIRPLLKDCVFVYKNMKIRKVLDELRSKKQYMAIVTDDYGGTLGLVTMEDILEELVGEIWDESDQVVNAVEKIGDKVYDVNGEASVFDLFEELELDTDSLSEEYTTVSGWALEHLEHIPQAGESFVSENLRVTVKELDDQRITRLTLEILDRPEEKAETPSGKSEEPSSKE